MKKSILYMILVAIICLSSCSDSEDYIQDIYEDKVLQSMGSYNSKEFYSNGTFQDYTDYAKYYYDTIDFDGNNYLSKVKKSDILKLYSYVDNFEKWIQAINDNSDELVINYDFNRSIIGTEDYYYIFDRMNEKLYEKYDYYDVYFFDSQTSTLYYFHNNI